NIARWDIVSIKLHFLPPHPLRIRLAGYPRKHNEGRVEVFYNGEWGTICDDNFILANAHVLCHLGFVEALSWLHSAKYGPGTGKIWLDNVMCGGSENSIEKCVSRGWGNSDCTHQEDAGVVCKDERLPGFADSNIIEMQVDENRMEKIRLRPLSGAYAGRMPVTEGVIEVKFKEGWGHICNTGWPTKNARVVCGIMGFPSQRTMGKKPSSLQSVYRIYSVFSKANSSASCPDGGAAVVNCVPGAAVHTGQSLQLTMLLPFGAKTGEGRVEVLKGSEWGTVCDDRWNLQSASVVCRELGFGTAKEALTGARMGQGMGTIYMIEVQCHGDEKSLWDCPHKSITAEDCKHMEDASRHLHINHDSTICLTGGRMRLEGRVELLLSTGRGLREWGLVCGDGWTSREAMVVCRQLGLGHASSGLRPVIFQRYLMVFGWFNHVRFQQTMFITSRHYHSMDIFTYYDLLSLNGTKVADGHKASFCLEDTECHEGKRQRSKVICWTCLYNEDQPPWIDITDVKPGNYILQVTINPNFEVAESDFTNNAMRCNCKYDGNRVWLHKCHLGETGCCSLAPSDLPDFEHLMGIK
uniref:Lysyl oxidase homolog n=1 Tax=Sinocyclocheilus grahami TaxID=75366 RepID=A0A672MPE6_SINGR